MNVKDMADALSSGQSFTSEELVIEYNKAHPGLATLNDVLSAQWGVNHALTKAVTAILKGETAQAVTAIQEASTAHAPIAHILKERSDSIVAQLGTIANGLINART